MTLHIGTLLAGVIYFAIGVAFVFEALGAWTLSIGDLRFVGPLALVVAGFAVAIGSVTKADRPDRTR